MKKYQIRSAILLYLQMIPVWIVLWLFFVFLRNYGHLIGNVESPLSKLGSGQGLVIGVLVGSLAGIIYTSVELLFERRFFQKQSYARIIAGKLVFFFIGVKILLLFGLNAINSIDPTIFESMELVALLRSESYWVVFIYFTVVASLISFLRMISRKFGPGVLWNMFIGRYQNPREEQRIFMFLDLRSSTTIAEKLGHVKFSKLIQDCFADLTPVVNNHKVEIYQYVGDEAVLSWTMEKGMEENHCIHAYFNFMEVLALKSDYYEKVYGLQPFFKAGVHLGTVIVTEVGLVKREIAYHGDVLNTTARIQSQCNKLQQALLVSGQLLDQLQPDNQIEIKPLGEEILKGKKTPVTIYGVSRG